LWRVALFLQWAMGKAGRQVRRGRGGHTEAQRGKGRVEDKRGKGEGKNLEPSPRSSPVGDGRGRRRRHWGPLVPALPFGSKQGTQSNREEGSRREAKHASRVVIGHGTAGQGHGTGDGQWGRQEGRYAEGAEVRRGAERAEYRGKARVGSPRLGPLPVGEGGSQKTLGATVPALPFGSKQGTQSNREAGHPSWRVFGEGV
jgi:hypothetical protein